MTLTSSSDSGSVHATRLPTPGVPLNRVGESCGISASFASSAVSAVPWPASSTAFAGSDHIATPFSTSVAPTLRAMLMTPDNGASSCPSGSSGSSRLCGCGLERHGRRTVRGRIGHRQHDAHQRNTIGVAMVNAHDERAAALVAVDQVELPPRTRRIERRGGEARYEVLQFAPAGRGRAARCGRRAARCRNARRFPRRRLSAFRPGVAGTA